MERNNSMNRNIEKLKNRFYKYVAITSQSDGSQTRIPSTVGQLELGKILAEDLAELGLTDITIDDSGVVYGLLKARLGEGHKPVPKVGWCAHMDTVDVKLSPQIHPILIENYQGGDIIQNAEKDLGIRIEEHPELLEYIGQDIIVSDGTSVLGADNKAAIAIIMTALELLKEDESIEHGDIYIAFVPDEEIGLRGSKAMDFGRFPVDFAYTIDCCAKGDVVYETFNAGTAKVSITGVPAHPMSSKNNLVNPAMVAVDYINLLDRGEMPEHTEGREGFLWVTDIVADELNATIMIDIRDHNLKKYKAKEEFLQKALEMTQLKHPRAKLEIEIFETYSNIADALTDDNKICIDYIYKALEELGIAANTTPMRGGTDGSFISTKGIPTPNYFTGAHNFHSTAEFLPVESFESSLKLTMKLISLIAK